MRWDIIVPLAVYLVLLIGIAVWAYNQRQAVGTGGKSAEYYIAGRGLGWFILVFTLLASAASAGTYIGGPGFGYEWGYGWVLAAMAQVPAVLMVLGVLGKKFAIVARKLHALTVTDFLRHRYESHVVVILVYRQTRDFPILLNVPHVFSAKTREMGVGDAGFEPASSAV
jgi:sodium/pantothenate symporter